MHLVENVEHPESNLLPCFGNPSNTTANEKDDDCKAEGSSDNTTPAFCTTRTILPAMQLKPDSTTEYCFEHSLLPDEAVLLQKNVAARGEAKEHKVTWSYDDHVDPDSVEGTALGELGRGRATASGEFIRNMKVGDVVTVWGKARFPGWTNHVDEVKIEVYWAI
jgi:hypothetical protein